MSNRQRWHLPLVVLLLVTCIAWGAVGQISGRFGIDLVTRKIPTTVTGEIKLDTPSEFALLEFAIASKLDVTAGFGWGTLDLDAAVNMAGPEHLVTGLDLDIRSVDFYGTWIDQIQVTPEIWFAVPFEAITDVNNLPNAVVIPPAKPLFVTARATTALHVDGFDINHLLMFSDVNFPSPSSSYDPLTYGPQTQSFAWGTLARVSWKAQMGFMVRAIAGVNASSSATMIKGHSASGRVVPDNCFLTASISGIDISCCDIGPFEITDSRLGLSFTVSTVQSSSATLSYSGRLPGGVSVSTSLALLTFPRKLSGVRLSGVIGPVSFSVLLDKLQLTSLSARFNQQLNLGGTTASISASATGLERGLTGASAQLVLSRGIFSANTSIACAQRGDEFGFASWATSVSLRLSPATITLQAVFGPYGLTRAAAGVGVVF